MYEELDLVAVTTQLAYSPQVVGNAFPALPGYVVDRVFDDQWDNTGFYAVGFLNEESQRVVIAIRGSEDRLDVVTDASLGAGQYTANKSPLIDYVGQNILANRITIAGHSLGGGLSQYLGYDAATTFSAFRDKLTVHTHNGFGGLLGIAKMHGRFDPAAVEGVTFRNFRHPFDPVSRIGGQAGGVSNIIDPDGRSRDLLFAHSNKRFLREESDHSPFEGASTADDDAFDLTQTLEELGPQMSMALRNILTNDRPLLGVLRVGRLLRMVPRAERSSFFALLGDVFPLTRIMQRMSYNDAMKEIDAIGARKKQREPARDSSLLR
jgi:hypothetical protein